MVVGISCAGGIMLIFGTQRYCCEVSASRGAFSCAGSPGRIVSRAGDKSVVSFA